MKSIASLLAAVSAGAVAAFAPKDIPRLIEQADLAESAPTDGSCMCAGNPVIEIRKNGAPTKTITIHHGLTIRMRGAKLNAKVGSPERLAEWLANNGFHSTKNELGKTEKSTGKNSEPQAARGK